MIPPTFDYHVPDTLPEAIGLLAQHGEEAKLLAGGHSLLPMMKLRFAEPAHLIDLNGIQELKGITEADGKIVIGAMTTESELIASELLRQKCPLLPEAAKVIADPQVRNRGTIGGDVAHGDPGNDHPAVMMAADAIFVLKGPDGERRVAATAFYLGTFYTVMAPEEILTEIQVPPFRANSGYSYQKLKRKTGDYATAASAVVLELAGDTCQRINIALTNVGATALKAEAAEQILAGKAMTEDLIDQAARKAMDICEPVKDLRGDIEYKTHMAGEMTRRAIRQSLQRARG